tara:strand:- start:318 stop:458 length:141 start_codon:yes stop_codon:yes gene_type:complete
MDFTSHLNGGRVGAGKRKTKKRKKTHLPCQQVEMGKGAHRLPGSVN